MRNINAKLKETLIIGLIFFTMGICSIFITRFISEYQLLEKIGRGFYNSNAIVFDINDSKASMEINDILTNIKECQILYKKIDDNTRLVYFNSDKYEIPILKGRTLLKKDLNLDTNSIIAGKDRLNEVENKENIVGTIGYSINSKLDKLLIAPLNKSNKNISLNGVWIIDGKNNINESYNNIKNIVESYGNTINKVPGYDSGVSRLFNNKQINIYIFILIFIMFISCLLTVVYYLLLVKKEDIKIMLTCGLSINDILKECFIKKIYLSIISYVCGLFISYIWCVFIVDYIINYKTLVTVITLFIILCFICLFVFIKLWIYKYVRRLRNDF